MKFIKLKNEIVNFIFNYKNNYILTQNKIDNFIFEIN